MRMLLISTLLMVLAMLACEANGKLISENDELMVVEPQDLVDKPELVVSKKLKSSGKDKDCDDDDDDDDDDHDRHNHKDCDDDDENTSEVPSAEKDDDLSIGAIVGIVVACVVFLVVLVTSMVVGCRRSSPKPVVPPVMKTVYVADPEQMNPTGLPENLNDSPPPYSPEPMSNETRPPPYSSG